MCGIVAVVEDRASRAVVERMRDAIAHRGPDDAGAYVDDGVALGHRRLAIIDLSPAGHQPMSSHDGSLQLVFNGEIYNYVELRDELAARGHAFSSHTDSEVVLKLYQESGERCVERLRGMFAFAIWDRPRQTLFAARDRLGKKPLYYARVGDGLAVASEIKALLRHPGVRSTPQLRALVHYLALQYVPSPLTAFEGVERLPPAHSLCWHGGRLTIRRYWRLEYTPKRASRDDEALEALESTLSEAVRIRLRSDVPVGVLLSGGVDSSLVAALAARHATRLKTFTIGFREAAYDERRHARRVAEHLGAEHHEVEAHADLVKLLPRLVRQYDQPFADLAALPTLVLSEVTRRHVTVALNGDGGDETFAGYERYGGAPHWTAFQRLPRILRSRTLWVRAASFANVLRSRSGRRVLRLQELGSESLEQHYARSMSHFNREWLAELLSDELRGLAERWDAWEPLREAFAEARRRGLGPLDTLLSVDTATYLPDCLLVKVDVASMAHGLEVRSPLLDHEVVELAAALPETVKGRGRKTKLLLKKLARRHLPVAVVDRPKAGFGVPLAAWLRTELREMLRDLLLDGRLARRGLVRPKVVERLVEDHLVRSIDRGAMLWNLLVLEMWHREVVEGGA